ncbi:hypothetical protein QR685DRAFT_436110, partial [Neurospora intermedia]
LSAQEMEVSSKAKRDILPLTAQTIHNPIAASGVLDISTLRYLINLALTGSLSMVTQLDDRNPV